MGSNPYIHSIKSKGVLKMNNFLETLKSQFIEDNNVTLVIFEPELEKYLNIETGILMYVYKDEETKDVISIEFVGV